MNTHVTAEGPISLSPTLDLLDNQLRYSIQKNNNTDTDGSSPPRSRNVDLRKAVGNASCSFPDDVTAATTLASYRSFGDSTIAYYRRRSGSILKSLSSISSSSIKRRVSFSDAPTRVFTIENKEEYFDDMFYDQESLADFRYQALMWEAGMVDENGTPYAVLQSANKTKDKFEKMDEMNGSLDFDDLSLDGLKPTQNQNGPLVQAEDLGKENGRGAIQDLEGSMDASDQQRKFTAKFFGNLQDWDDDLDTDDNDDYINSDEEDDELNEDLDRPFNKLNIGIPEALSSTEEFEGQRDRMPIERNKKEVGGCIFGKSMPFIMDSEDDSTSESSQRSSTYHGNRQGSFRSFTSDGDDGDRSIPYNDGSQRSRRSVRDTRKSDMVRMSLTSLSDIFSSSESLDVSDHKTDSGEEDKRTRLMAKMKGLRESLRSIQSLQDTDSDDDSDGGNCCHEEGGANTIIDGIATKNLKRSLIIKHKIYSPKPNGKSSITLERLGSVKELSVPEI